MKNQLRKLIREKIELDINIGDEILTGRYRNKKVIVKDIGKDELNQPTINGKAILKFRIKKLIKEEIDKIFEVMGFQSAATEQIATNMALFRLPRKGMDDFINNYNQVQFALEKEKDDAEKEEDLENNFKSPTLSPNAVTSTNMYESEKKPKPVEENFNDNNIYDGTAAAQDNLDWDRGLDVQTANFGKDTQALVDLHNDNINRSLNEVPPGNAREKGTENNMNKERM